MRAQGRVAPAFKRLKDDRVLYTFALARFPDNPRIPVMEIALYDDGRLVTRFLPDEGDDDGG